METLRDRALDVFSRGSAPSKFVLEACALVDRLFSGQMWSYQAIELRYHDFQHTVQASWTYLDLLEAARLHLGPDLAPGSREGELGFAAVLLHDTGYLKAKGDDVGTGAKYTYSHVLRSCALCASLLPGLGCLPAEVDDVLGMIRCTGLTGSPSNTTFGSAGARHIACMVATADYLGQMAAPEYPAKLPSLFTEFSEADAYTNVPPEKRSFTSVQQLLAATPAFWERFVVPKLTKDFGGVYRYLARPYPDGPNPYVGAIEDNIRKIMARSNPPFATTAA